LNGRRLMVEFKCQRCGTTATRPLKECIDEVDCPHDLTDLRPPRGWRNGGFYHPPTFCPACAEKYDRFMSGKDGGNDS
jgi:hypothetical protein